MPSDTLDLLDRIVKGAEAAAGKGAGQPLRAGEWNTLAEAIARLARLAAARERGEQETLAKDYARADHLHLGQIGLTWFDAPTRELIEARAGAGEVAARLDTLARDTKALRAELAALTGQVNNMRDDLSGATTEDLVRDGNIRDLGNRLDGVLDIGRRVTALDGRVAGIDAGVREAIAFRDTLRDVTGAPVDVATLVQRVDGIAANQERLRLANGEVVRMRDFENRIATLEQNRVSASDLDNRIGTRLEVLLAEADSPLVSRAGAAAASSLDPRLTTIESGLAAASRNVNAMQEARTADSVRIDGLDARLTAEVSRSDRNAANLDALGALPSRVTAVEASVNAANQRLGVVDALTADLARVREQAATGAALVPRVAAMETASQTQERRIAANETIIAGIPDLRGRIDAAEASAARADALSGRITTLEGQVTAIGSRVTVTESRLGTLDSLTSRVSVMERSTTELTSWRQGVDARLNTLPSQTALRDLTSRVAAVEQRAAAQQVSLDRLSVTSGTTRVIATPIARPTG